MKIPLNRLNPEKSQEFLIYFTALLKEKNKSPFIGNASAYFNENGQYETTINDQITNHSGIVSPIQWKIIQNNDGSIPFIEVLSLTGTEPQDCKTEINQFITDVSLAAFSQSKKSFFHRSYYCYIGSHNLTGEFWIDRNVRIAPLYENDNSFQPISEKIIVIDQRIDAIDEFHSKQIAEIKAIHIASFSSFMLDVGLYLPKREERWILYRDEETKQIKNKRFITGIMDSHCPLRMPKKGKQLNVAQPFESLFIKGERPFWDKITFPIETKKILKSLDKTDSKNFNAFDRFCRLYQIGLCIGLEYPTIKMSYFYAAVDAICKTTGNYKGFTDFIIKNLPEADEKLLDLVHSKIRSAHWHAGTFFLGEDEAKTREFILDWNYHLKSQIITKAEKTIRNATINWIFNKIVKK